MLRLHLRSNTSILTGHSDETPVCVYDTKQS
jgi:hypothetical protein